MDVSLHVNNREEKKMKKQKRKKDSFWKRVKEESREYIVIEILVHIILFIPRLLIRIIKHLF
jgi:hypothetical protein